MEYLSFYLLYKLNHVFCAFTFFFLSFNFTFMILRAKSSKMSIFYSSVKNFDLSLELNLLVNMSLMICSISKTELRISSYCNFMQIMIIMFTSKTWFSTEHCCQFWGCQWILGIEICPKVVYISISTLGWPCTQNEV